MDFALFVAVLFLVQVIVTWLGLILGCRLVRAPLPSWRGIGLSALACLLVWGLSLAFDDRGLTSWYVVGLVTLAALLFWALRRLTGAGWARALVPWLGVSGGLVLGLVILAFGAMGLPFGHSHSPQKRTVADIRNTGTAMMSWLTDQIATSSVEGSAEATAVAAGHAPAAAAGEAPGADREPRAASAQAAPPAAPSHSEVAPPAAADATNEPAVPPQPETVTMTDFPVISRADLAELLTPLYVQAVPEHDGWKHAFEYRLSSANPLAHHVMAIRSPGKDGVYQTDTYVAGPFDPTDYDQDIVWADGFFVRWPQSPQQLSQAP